MVCDDRLGSANMLKVLKCTTSIRAFAESSGRATRKGSPTRVLENRANQLPQFSADEFAIHWQPVLYPASTRKANHREQALAQVSAVYSRNSRACSEGGDLIGHHV